MNDEPIGPVSAARARAPDGKQAALIARRRLLRGSVGVAPILMVSVPRSVMAGGTFLTASAFAVPVNPSGAALANAPTCSGHLPEYWSGCSLTDWPSSCLHNDNKTKFFNEIFGSSNGFENTTRLRDVLQFSEANAKNKLAKYIVAALLNARKELTPAEILSETTTKAIWTACSAGSYYEPTAGVKWYAGTSEPPSSGGCVEWLKSTMS